MILLNFKWKFNLLEETWTLVQIEKVKERSHFASLQLNEKIYFFGGKTLDDQSLKDFFYFNCETEEITMLKLTKDYNSGCSSSLCFWNDSFYLFGGLIEGARSKKVIKITHEKDNLYRWEYLNTQMPVANSNASLIIKGNDAYIFGGYSVDSKILSTVYKYSFENDQWSTYSKIPFGESYAHFTFETHHNHLVLFYGGSKEKDDFTTLYFYDIFQDKWDLIETQNDSPVETYFPSVCFDGKKLYIFGGFHNRQSFNTLHTLDISSYFHIDIYKLIENKKTLNMFFWFD